MRRLLANVALTIAPLAGGAIVRAAGHPALAGTIWLVSALVLGSPLVVDTIRGAVEGRLATDIVASLSIVGAIVLHQPVAALVIVLTQHGGKALELGAELHASAALKALEARSPHIAEIMRMARGSKAPLQRTADRYATWFTPIVVTICAIAVGVTHEWTRVLAILVVATPCPLVLATPVAILGGIGRAARSRILVSTGGTLERLAGIDAVVFDKTGTVTVGKPRIHAIRIAPGFDRGTVLRYAAAVEQHSRHLLARVLIDAVLAESHEVPRSRRHVESLGLGVSGIVEGHRVTVGARAFVVPHCRGGSRSAAQLEQSEAALRSYISIGNELAAVVEYADDVRPELEGVLQQLRRAGVRHHAMVSGDNDAAIALLAQRLAIDDAHGDLLPHDKARFVSALRAAGHRVMMVGDAIADAPALSVADVGVVLASRTVTTETAPDVLLLTDSLNGIFTAIQIGRRTIRIARQSIWIGLGLSAVAMLVAAFGGLSAIVGAAIQETIDVAVILNAMRSSVDERSLHSTMTNATQSSPGSTRAAWPGPAVSSR